MTPRDNCPQILTLFLFSMLLVLLPAQGSTTELLVEGKTAEVGVDVVYVKAGAGVAFVNKGRLYRGDLIKILSKKNLSNWVHIQSGRIKGYVPLKVLRFDTRDNRAITDPNMIRRFEEYQYDDAGRRIKRTGERVGSGETDKAPRSKAATSQTRIPHPIELKFALGVGRFERHFQSNAPVQRVHYRVHAQPVDVTRLF